MSRIIDRQRQLAEQGRLRLGYTVPAKKRDGSDTTRPVASKTWVLTSHSEDHVQAAAALWGGDVEKWQPMGNGAEQFRVITKTTAIPAFLPPGDPLSQAYEQWTRGGCVRRCDGATEQFSGNPCLCLAEFGEHWYDESPKDVCQSKSRLKVLLPDMPGLGSWRMETGSFYATDEIAGMVDTIRASVGDSVIIPVTLRIEPRTRVAGGETKQFVVPVVELRGVTAGVLLSGAVDQIALASGVNQHTKAIGTGSQPVDEMVATLAPYYELLADATTSVECLAVFERAKDDGLFHGDRKDLHPLVNALYDAIGERGRTLSAEPAGSTAGDEPVDADVVDAPAADGDADTVWQQVLAEAGKNGMGLSEVTSDFEQRYSLNPGQASAGELAHYLEVLKTGEAA